MADQSFSEQVGCVITPGNSEQHLMAVTRMVADAFAGGGYLEEIAAKYIGSVHYDWDSTRLAWDGERLVHHWGVWGYLMRLESIRLKVAGVGAVVTDENYRKRGLMASAAQQSFEAMRANGYDLSILRGRHYVKFGYARAWNYVTYRLKADEIPNLALQGSYDLLPPEQMGMIEERYNQDYRDFTGTALRPTYRMLQAEDMYAYGWMNANGELAGYVRAVPGEEPKTLLCLEATGDPLQGLAVLADLFHKGDYDTLAFFTLPHFHPMLQIMRKGNCVVENRYFHPSGWRVRIVNLRSTLQKLSPLLATRLQYSGMMGWEGVLLIDAGEQQAALQMENGLVYVADAQDSEHVLRGGADIARLIIGSDEPQEVLAQAGMYCTGAAEELAKALFPNLYPVMSQWEEF